MSTDTLTLCDTIISECEHRADVRTRLLHWQTEDSLRAAAAYWASQGGSRPVDPSERRSALRRLLGRKGK